MDEESGTHGQNVLTKICPCFITNLGITVPKVFQHVLNLRNISYVGQRDDDTTQKKFHMPQMLYNDFYQVI